MNGDNIAILHGFAGKDTELKVTPAGRPLGKFSLATTEKWKTKEGESKEKTQWHQCVCWDKLGELAEKLVKKGSEVNVWGKIEYTEVPDKNDPNKKVYFTSIIVDGFRLCGKRSDGPGSRPDPDPPEHTMGASDPTSYVPSTNAPATQADYGEEIPF